MVDSLDEVLCVVQELRSWDAILVLIGEIVVIEDSWRHLILLESKLGIAQRSTAACTLKLILLITHVATLELALLDL